MKKIHVDLNENSYHIHIQKGILGSMGQNLKDIYKGEKVFIITDSNVNALYGQKLVSVLKQNGFLTNLLVLPAGEKTKSFDSLPFIYNELIQFGITRSDMIIAFGGGVIGDLAGFAAATFLRGVNYVQVPTTLLSQVDSSVGGKVAVDLPQGKNLVGNFYQPKAVFIDPLLLETLTPHFFADGMGEVIKYGLIRDKKLFDLLHSLNSRAEIMNQIEEIIYTCCNIKREIVQNDEKDKGERMLLNFGHTIGHGIEKIYDFSVYSHGAAVAAGMYEITCLSEKLNLTQQGTAEQIKELLVKNALPFAIEYDKNKLKQAIAVDKKNMGKQLHVILLKEIGRSFIYHTNADFFDGLKKSE